MSIFHTHIHFSPDERAQSKFLCHIEALSSSRWNEHAVFQYYQIQIYRSGKVIQFLQEFVYWVQEEMKRHPEQTEKEIRDQAWVWVKTKRGHSWFHLSSMEIDALLRQVWKAYPYYRASRTYLECIEAMTGYKAQVKKIHEKETQMKHAVKKQTRRRKSTKSAK
jgi:hypothetical protein